MPTLERIQNLDSFFVMRTLFANWSILTILSPVEQQKNIIYITGIDTYWVRGEKERWKQLFRERQGSENIEEIRIEEVTDWSRIEQNMQSMGLFAEKRLWCISWGKKKRKEEDVEEEKESVKLAKKKESEIESRILALVENIGDEQVVIFSWLNYDSAKWVLIPWLEKHAQIKKFNTLWSGESWEKRFPNLDTSVVEKVLQAYKDAESTKEETSITVSDAIWWSLEKLSLLRESWTIRDEAIWESLDRAYSGKIFDLSDAILARDFRKSMKLLKRILESTTPYELLPVLIGGLRSAVYMKYLQTRGIWEKEVQKLLKVHPYVFSKVMQSRISYREINQFYSKLIDANIAYKSGGWMQDTELWRIFAIELAILGLQKKDFP